MGLSLNGNYGGNTPTLTTQPPSLLDQLRSAAQQGVQGVSNAFKPPSNINPNSYGNSGNPDVEAAKAKIAGFGQQYQGAATQQQRDDLHNQAMTVGTAAGGTYNSGTGQWDFSNPDAKGNDIGTQLSPQSTQVQQLLQARSGQNGNADLINQQYDANYQSQLQKLREANQISQQGLNQQQEVVGQNRISQLNNNDAVGAQQLKRLQEVQANNGVRGGDSITATIGQNTAQGQNANSIEQNAGNQLNDIQQKRSLINNNSQANEMSLMQQLQAARSGQLIDDNNTQQQRALQLATLMGRTADGQQTLGGQAQSLAAQNQGFNQGIQQAGITGTYNNAPTFAASQQDFANKLNMGQATGTFGNGQKTVAQQQLDSQNDPNSLDGRLKVAQAKYYADHGSYYAGGGSQNGANAAGNIAKNNSYAASVYDQLSQLQPSDYEGFLNHYEGEIVHNIGQKGFDDLKKSVMADQNAQGKADLAQGKTDTAKRDRAVAAAQKDPDWKISNATERAALIKEYEGYNN